MNKGTLLAIIAVVGYIGLEAYGVKNAQHRLEPLYIFDQFVTARSATDRCGAPEPEQEADFLANLAVVTRTAARELSETHPDKSATAIEQMLSERTQARDQEVVALIAAGGCEDKAIWTMMKRYEIRARLNLG